MIRKTAAPPQGEIKKRFQEYHLQGIYRCKCRSNKQQFHVSYTCVFHCTFNWSVTISLPVSKHLNQILGSCNGASWTQGEERESNKMQLIWFLLFGCFIVCRLNVPTFRWDSLPLQVDWLFILFIVILQYIIRQHNNNRVNVYCYTFRLRRVIIRLII